METPFPWCRTAEHPQLQLTVSDDYTMVVRYRQMIRYPSREDEQPIFPIFSSWF